MRKHLWILLLVCLAGCGNEQQHSGAATATDPAAAPQLGSGHDTRDGAAAPAPAPQRPVVEEVIAYGEAADRNLTGLLALPEDSFEPPPGVLLIHDARGLDDDMRALARRMAGEGFVVLAIDLYADEVATSEIEAQSLMTGVMTQPVAALENIRQGIEYLRRYALAPSVAVFGWSFGGTWSLQAGLEFPDELDAVVVYYGQIVTSEVSLKRLGSPLLGVYAGADEAIPSESVVRFRAALAAAGKDAAVRIFPDARHDFANPGSEHYRAEDAEDAWQLAVEFLSARLAASASPINGEKIVGAESDL